MRVDGFSASSPAIKDKKSRLPGFSISVRTEAEDGPMDVAASSARATSGSSLAWVIVVVVVVVVSLSLANFAHVSFSLSSREKALLSFPLRYSSVN